VGRIASVSCSTLLQYHYTNAAFARPVSVLETAAAAAAANVSSSTAPGRIVRPLSPELAAVTTNDLRYIIIVVVVIVVTHMSACGYTRGRCRRGRKRKETGKKKYK